MSEPSLLSVPLAQRSVSMESAASSYADCKSNMESEDDDEELDLMDDYYNEDEVGTSKWSLWSIHSVL